jgi:hypothetical protein
MEILCCLTVPSLSGSPQRAADLESVRQPLQKARNDVAHMPGGWGGHMEAAASHIDAALKELDEAEKWAREHHEMK